MDYSSKILNFCFSFSNQTINSYFTKCYIQFLLIQLIESFLHVICSIKTDLHHQIISIISCKINIICPSPIQFSQEDNSNGTKWISDLCYYYTKYGGTPNVTSYEFLNFFKMNWISIEDEDTIDIVDCIERRLGNTTLEYISSSLNNWLLINKDVCSKEVQEMFTF